MKRAAILCIATLVSACSVPQAFQIGNSTNPQYEDQNVLFRTTYYLRVFDVCRVDESGRYANYDRGTAKLLHRQMGAYRIIKDSLYRFRMTGQAQALLNDVRFESGTLRDYQIDPFGRTVEFDEKLKRFRAPDVLSTQQGPNNSSTSQPNTLPPTIPPQGNINPCPPGQAHEAQFYLLGPEGVKKLDPSERLIMAMSTDGKPLVSALQRIAGIKAQTEAEVEAQYYVKREEARAAVATELLENEKKTLAAFDPTKTNLANSPSSTPASLSKAILDLFDSQGSAGGTSK
ncbi:MAG: hypothetical protein ABL970_09020 [Nitrospira sp.]